MWDDAAQLGTLATGERVKMIGGKAEYLVTDIGRENGNDDGHSWMVNLRTGSAFRMCNSTWVVQLLPVATRFRNSDR
jgi:hypothetical protein